MTSSGKRALVAIVILLVLIAAAAVYFLRPHPPAPIVPVTPGPPPDVLSMLPPGATVIAFGDVAALRASPFAADLAAIAPAPDEDKDYRDFVRATGFDYSRDLDRFAADAWLDYSKPLPNGAPRVSLIALADGRFDREKLSAYALRSGTISKHGDIDVYDMPSGTPNENISFAFLSPGRIALAQGMNLDPVLSNTSTKNL